MTSIPQHPSFARCMASGSEKNDVAGSVAKKSPLYSRRLLPGLTLALAGNRRGVDLIARKVAAKATCCAFGLHSEGS